MDDHRWARILLALANTEGRAGPRLCAMSAQLVAVSGAGISLMTEQGPARVTVCASNLVAQEMEDLQFSLNEGPCVDAYFSNQPVLEADLAASRSGRWPSFAPAALAAGAAAVFGFPLRAAGARIGTLNLYQAQPGELTSEQFANALMVADVIAQQVLIIQATTTSGLADPLADQTALRLVVHQATGMIAVQLDIGVGDALTCLRARAFSQGVSVTSLAVDVVDRKVRFGTDLGPATGNPPQGV